MVASGKTTEYGGDEQHHPHDGRQQEARASYDASFGGGLVSNVCSSSVFVFLTSALEAKAARGRPAPGVGSTPPESCGSRGPTGNRNRHRAGSARRPLIVAGRSRNSATGDSPVAPSSRATAIGCSSTKGPLALVTSQVGAGASWARRQARYVGPKCQRDVDRGNCPTRLFGIRACLTTSISYVTSAWSQSSISA